MQKIKIKEVSQLPSMIPTEGLGCPEECEHRKTTCMALHAWREKGEALVPVKCPQLKNRAMKH